MNLAKKRVLVVAASSPGDMGNSIRLEVSYGTAMPDETFNLTVIQQDQAGQELDREAFQALNMDPTSPRFAPDYVTRNSGLVKLELHADVKPGSAGDINVIGNSFPGFSQSRVFSTTPIAPFRTEFEMLLTGTPNFVLNVDG